MIIHENINIDDFIGNKWLQIDEKSHLFIRMRGDLSDKKFSCLLIYFRISHDNFLVEEGARRGIYSCLRCFPRACPRPPSVRRSCASPTAPSARGDADCVPGVFSARRKLSSATRTARARPRSVRRRSAASRVGFSRRRATSRSSGKRRSLAAAGRPGWTRRRPGWSLTS